MNKKIMFTIGTDTEFFLKSRSKGEYRSAIPVFKGTKHAPELLDNGSGLSFDNVAGEFATPVAKSFGGFVKMIKTSYDIIRSKIPSDYEIDIVPSAIFPKEELEHPEAKRAGCEPDFNIWKMDVNTPADLSEQQLRSAGGHIHVGFEKYPHLLKKTHKKANILKLMDCFHGIFGVICDNTEESKRRRELYGKAGCFRDKVYGVEYRTLSNFWTKKWAYTFVVFKLTETVVSLAARGQERHILKLADNVQQIIDSGDRAEAIKFYTLTKKYIPTAVQKIIDREITYA